VSFQVGAACYESIEGAAAAVASAEIGRVVPAGSGVFVVDAVAGSGGSITYTLTDPASVVSPVVYVSSPSLPECGLLTAADGLALGWGVAAAWIGVFAVLALRRGL